MDTRSARKIALLTYERWLHRKKDGHHGGSSLVSDVILGGQDGMVNVLGIVLGVAAATNDPRVVMVAGLAATFAESVSMGAVAYTSTLAEAEFYESEREREYRHIHQYPNVEKEEIREIFEKKGFEGETLERIVDVITANKDAWVDLMMAEEHKLVPASRGSALRSALIVGLSAIAGSLIPLAPFALMPPRAGIWISIAITALILFIGGVMKARMTVGRPGRSGLEMAVIGTVSALVGYAVGLIMKIP